MDEIQFEVDFRALPLMFPAFINQSFFHPQCNNCFKLLLHPHQRLNFFSDYSHSVTCPYCQSQDTHFIKPLNYCYTNKAIQQFQQWPA